MCGIAGYLVDITDMHRSILIMNRWLESQTTLSFRG